MGISVRGNSTERFLEPVANRCDLFACGKGGHLVRAFDFRLEAIVPKVGRQVMTSQMQAHRGGS